MTLPKNVFLFEVLLYLSLVLDALSVAFQDRTPNAETTESMITTATLMAACLILLLVYFVWLAAQQAQELAALGAGHAAGAFDLLGGADDRRERPAARQRHRDVSCALTAAGLYFSFTGDAQGWFNA